MGKPHRRKKDHGRGERRVAGFGEVEARNAAMERRPGKGRDDESEEEEEEEEEEQPKQQQAAASKPSKSEKKASKASKEEEESSDDDIDDAPVETITRRQREEMNKAEARRRYEKLHREGKTDEAKADLERLAAVRERREQQKKEREAAEAAAREAEEAKKAAKEEKKKAKKEGKEEEKFKATVYHLSSGPNGPTHEGLQAERGTSAAKQELEEDFM